jgi:hypothetical protein
MATTASGTIDANGETVGPISVAHGRFDLSLAGTFSGTLTVQRRRPQDVNDEDWKNVEAFTEAVEKTGYMAGAWNVRVKATAWTSGAAKVVLQA